MPIYFSWFITALLSVSGDLQQSQPTAKWAPFILREIEILQQFDERDVILLEDPGCSTKPEILYRHTGFCHCHARRPCVSSRRLDTSPACSEDEGFATAGWPGPPG